MKHYDFEEDFHARDRKQSRKERKIAQKTDRSKFKKTDESIKTSAPIKEHHLKGKVISISGEGSSVDSDGKIYLCSLKGILKKEKGLSKNLIAVGDNVFFEPITENTGAIIHVDERFSFLSRTDISGKKEQLIAVNIDLAIICISIVEPELKPALVDRYLIATEKGNLHPIIVINKIDLLKRASLKEQELYKEFLSVYEPLGYPILSVSTTTGIGIESLKSYLKNKTSVFSGQSGVGKSSLLNACFGFSLKTGELAQKTIKGTHTTTVTQLLHLPEGGYCVDTPGIRSFSLWKLEPKDVTSHFHDIQQLAKKCKFPDCTHRTEPECAVLKALAQDKISSLRYESYKNLMIQAEEGSDKTTWD